MNLTDRRAMIHTTVCSLFALPAVLRAQEPTLESIFQPDQVDRAVRRGVDLLIEQQRPDGAIADRTNELAMTALAAMAMASTGIQPTPQTKPGRALQAAIDFVLHAGHQDEDGYFGDTDQSRMYGHGIVTLMLTEVLGMAASPPDNARIHMALVKAIKLILASQAISKPARLAGGWRYTPLSRDSDLSVSVWQVMALRSAKNDGLDVPGEAIDAAIAFLRNSYTSPLGDDGVPRDEISGFSYMPGTHHPTFAMTAAGLLAMQVCGQYESPLVVGAANWLLRNPPQSRERFFHYGLYYYAQAMHHVGGEHADQAGKLVRQLLIPSQQTNGAWIPQGEERNVGAVYATALAVLSLSVHYHYLPIYQR
jgi:hypothetical protein